MLGRLFPTSMLAIPVPSLVSGLHAGLFIARRDGGRRHPARIIDSHELILVRSGVLSMHEAGIPFRVAAGEALLLVQGREHGGSADYPSDLSFHWLHFRLAPAQEAFSVPQHSRPRRPGLLMEWMHRYCDDRISGQATPATAGALVHLMLSELAAAPRSAGSSPAAHLVGRAEAWIGHHYQDPVSTSDVARALGCNADYLGRVFRQVTGSSIVAAIHARRLGEARRRLIETVDRVEQVARQTGFGDVVHFRRIFRRHCGCTPGDFRALHARSFVNSD